MDCREVQELLHPYFDGELDLVRNVQVEDHMRNCAECARREKALRLVREAIVSRPLYHRAPDSLRARLQSASASPSAPNVRRRWSSLALAATAAGIMLVAASAVTAGIFWRSAALSEDRLTEQVAASHIRSLQVEHVTDVASSDQHTVKPWFRGKLDYSPQVLDLSSKGYPLTGGRLDYLIDRPVAALVYHRRQHVINVFTWPAPDGEERSVRSLSRQGYQIRTWRRAGMAYWVISDLNAQELDEFVNLLRERTPDPQP